MRRRLNESDIDRIVNRVLSEQVAPTKELSDCCKSAGITVPMACRQLYWIGFYQTKNMLLFVCSKATESKPVKLKTVIVTTMFL